MLVKVTSNKVVRITCWIHTGAFQHASVDRADETVYSQRLKQNDEGRPGRCLGGKRVQQVQELQVQNPARNRLSMFKKQKTQ